MKVFLDFTSNPVNLNNEFAIYLQGRQRSGDLENTTRTETENPTALLSKFAGFLADSDHGSSSNQILGILKAFSTALNVSLVHDYWIIDSGAIYHMTNKSSHLHDFEKMKNSSQVSVANGKGVSVVGKKEN